MLGCDSVGATNCLNFGNPEKPHIMWQFSQTIDGITKACEELEIPITGGNVSFYNETLGEGIYPTPVLGVVGILEDVHKAAKMHFAAPGRTIVLLRAGEAGDITDAETEFGSSEYAKEILGALWGYPPELDLEKEAALQKAVIELVQQGLVESTHDCADGGLAVALAEKAFPKGIGARVNLAAGGLFAEFALFGEDASRILISCDPEQVARIQQVAEKRGVRRRSDWGDDRGSAGNLARRRGRDFGAGCGIERGVRRRPGIGAADGSRTGGGRTEYVGTAASAVMGLS